MLPVIVIAVGCFLLGWLSCSIVYFIRAIGISISTVKMSYVIYLTLMNRGIEVLNYAHMNRLSALRKNNKFPGDSEYENLKESHLTMIELYKENCIFFLKSVHPDSFKSLLTFEDWSSAQIFLNNNKQLAFKFTKENDG